MHGRKKQPETKDMMSYSEGEQHPETSLNILLSFVTVYENKTPTSMHPVFHAVQTVINHQGQFPADTLTGL